MTAIWFERTGEVGRAADAITSSFSLDENFHFRLLSAEGMTSFDYKDVPEWTQLPDISFFNWSATYHPVSWTTLWLSNYTNMNSEVISYLPFDIIPDLHIRGFPRDRWWMKKSRTDVRYINESDPFLPLVEVCGEYAPYSRDPLVDRVRSYNLMVSESKSALVLPDYAYSLSLILSVVLGVGQFVLFSHWL